MPNKSLDLTNHVFGRLTALKITKNRTSDGSIKWLCLCSCGNKKEISTKHLRGGNTQSCGCLGVESRSTASFKHGASISVTKEGSNQLDYVIWYGIKSRCCYKNSANYKRYGARGIKLHKLWRKDFISFASYIRKLPNCPPENLLISRLFGKRLSITIDRIDNDGNYEPGNLRWATKKEQADNRSNSLKVSLNNKIMSLMDACRLCELKYQTVYWRLNKGQSLISALKGSSISVKKAFVVT